MTICENISKYYSTKQFLEQETILLLSQGIRKEHFIKMGDSLIRVGEEQFKSYEGEGKINFYDFSGRNTT